MAVKKPAIYRFPIFPRRALTPRLRYREPFSDFELSPFYRAPISRPRPAFQKSHAADGTSAALQA